MAALITDVSGVEEDSEPPNVFSAHWGELAEQLSGGAKQALEEHLKRTSELATTSNTPRTAATSETGVLETPRTLAADTNAQPDSPIASIKAAHAFRDTEYVDAPVSARSALTEDLDSPRTVSESPRGSPRAAGAGSDGLTSKSNADYSKLEYWEERFKEEESYDWLLTFEQIRSQLEPLLEPYTKEAKILLVGVGNSSFSADLYDAGYTNLVNMDYSAVVIERMREKHRLVRPRMRWEVADMCSMSFEAYRPFDVVLDKAALDALMVDEGSVWDPWESVITAADKTCRCVRQMFTSKIDAAVSSAKESILDSKAPTIEALAAAISRPSEEAVPEHTRLPGLFIMISFMQPHFRTKYLMGTHADRLEGMRAEEHDSISPYSPATGYCTRYDWTVRWETITMGKGSFEHYLYVIQTGK